MKHKSSADMVQEANARIENLSVEQTAVEYENEDTLIVDLRESEERNQLDAIPGSMSVPRGLLEFWADPASAIHKKEFKFDRRVILHCASGGRSALAADVLQQMGFSNVAHIDTGFNGWKEAGHPIEKLDMWFNS